MIQDPNGKVPVYIRFSRERTLISWLIRWFMWGDWSHVEICVNSTMAIGARWPKGVKVYYDVDNHFSDEKFFEVALTHEQHAKLFSWLDHQQGSPYDTAALFGFLFRRDWNDTDKWFCSELVAGAFKAAGYPLLHADHLNRVSPSHLVLSPRMNDSEGP